MVLIRYDTDNYEALPCALHNKLSVAEMLYKSVKRYM